jgi:glycerol-3-phosphate dehydrogenase
MEHEWAETAEDILWRRSKLGLHGGAASAERLSDWLGTADRKRRARA